MNSVANNLASMKWALVLGVLTIGTVGCQSRPTLNPFQARAVVTPPATGSFVPPPGTPAPYYPNRPGTPLPGPANSSGMMETVSPILTANALGNGAASSIRQTSSESSVLVGPTAPLAVASGSPLAIASGSPLAIASGSPAEAPLKIVENEIPLVTTAAVLPAGTAQSFGPGEPARFQPVGPVVSLETKASSEPPSVDPAAGKPVLSEPGVLSDSGVLNWKPTR